MSVGNSRLKAENRNVPDDEPAIACLKTAYVAVNDGTSIVLDCNGEIVSTTLIAAGIARREDSSNTTILSAPEPDHTVAQTRLEGDTSRQGDDYPKSRQRGVGEWRP